MGGFVGVEGCSDGFLTVLFCDLFWADVDVDWVFCFFVGDFFIFGCFCFF